VSRPTSWSCTSDCSKRRNAADRAELRSLFSDALAIEMEGAPVAQVCAERRVPFVVIRAISDAADDDAAADFLEFVDRQAAPLPSEIVAGLITHAR
jgi:adenosylhomocysteine nucleosidase